MPLRGATTDENERPPLDKGGLQGGGVWKFRKPPPDPLLVRGGGTSFSTRSSLSFELSAGDVDRARGSARSSWKQYVTLFVKRST